MANPNGVIVGKNAQVNVGSILATTKVLENPADIEKNELNFKRAKQDEGKIHNQGTINAKGFIALVGDKVQNDGTLNAQHTQETIVSQKEKRVCSHTGAPSLGDYPCYYPSWYSDTNPKWETKTIEERKDVVTPAQAILASGESFTMTLTDNGVNIDVDENTLASIVENNGAIVMEDGSITLSAASQEGVIDSAVNNNGILQATNLQLNKEGNIVLSAAKTDLGAKSQIKAEKLHFESPTDTVKLNSKAGSKITAKSIETESRSFYLKKLKLEGSFEREDSNDFWRRDGNVLTSTVSLNALGRVHVGDNYNNEDNFISTSMLSSMLNNSGKVTLKSHIGRGVTLDKTGHTFTGNLAVNSFRGTDSLLELYSSNDIKIQDANISSSAGRLFLLNKFFNYRNYLNDIPEGVTPLFSVQNATFDLNKGGIGSGLDTTAKKVYYHTTVKSAEDEARSFYNVNWNNVQLNNLDEVVLTGGIGKVTWDNVQHNGNANFYIHGGNTRLLGSSTYWEYGVKDLEERLTRGEATMFKSRWKYNRDTDYSLGREFNDYFDMWNVSEKRAHLETEININNSNLTTNDGFVHLMAKKVNLTNSNLNVNFDRNIQLDTYAPRINKLGINGDLTLDNSHIKVIGAEERGVSPDAKQGAASFFFVGNMLGKNLSTLLVKSHQGYTMRTDGNATLKGDTSKDDLQITLINTGIPAAPDNGITPSNGDTDLANAALSTGDAADTKTVIDQATITAIAPNGAPAYLAGLPLEISESASFSYYEQPRDARHNSHNNTAGEKQPLTQDEQQAIQDKALGKKTPDVVEQPEESMDNSTSGESSSENSGNNASSTESSENTSTGSAENITEDTASTGATSENSTDASSTENSESTENAVATPPETSSTDEEKKETETTEAETSDATATSEENEKVVAPAEPIVKEETVVTTEKEEATKPAEIVVKETETTPEEKEKVTPPSETVTKEVEAATTEKEKAASPAEIIVKEDTATPKEEEKTTPPVTTIVKEATVTAKEKEKAVTPNISQETENSSKTMTKQKSEVLAVLPNSEQVPFIQQFQDSNEVSLMLCSPDDPNSCKVENLGKQHTKATVDVGEVN